MMHDRWSADPAWMAAQPPVMAITFEGTYGPSPIASWNTQEDWRIVGKELALALGDHLEILPAFSFDSTQSSCVNTPLLEGLVQEVSGTPTVYLLISNAPHPSTGWLVASSTLSNLALPPLGCSLDVTPDLVLPVTLNIHGQGALIAALPLGLPLDLELQFVALTGNATIPEFHTSNRLGFRAIW